MFDNPGAPEILAGIFRSARVHLVPPASDFLARAEALAEGLAHLDRAKRCALQSGTTARGEPLSDALDAVSADLSDRLDENLARGPLPDDLGDPDPASLVSVRTLNPWRFAGQTMRLADRAEVPPGVARWLRDHGKAKTINNLPNEV